jgi:hypothetical protein
MTGLLEQEIITRYKRGESSVKIGAALGIKAPTIISVLMRNKIPRRTLSEVKQKYSFNENFFSEVKNEEEAYWLGFILADGCVCRNDIIIALKHSDKKHLRKFIKSIQGNNKIQKVNAKTTYGTFPIARLSIRSQKLYEDLVKLGITPNKTKTIHAPKLPKELLRHFWRGVFDGDGHISFYTQTYKNSVYKIFEVGCCGNENIIDSFTKFLRNSLNIEIKSRLDKGTTFRWSAVGKKARTIHHFLYNEATVFLERKKNV